MSPQSPHSYAVLHERLEECVSMVLSLRRSVEDPARELSRLDRGLQDRFLDAVEYISQETVELAYNFCQFGVPGLTLLENEQHWKSWVQHLLDTYDQGGVIATIVAMQKIDDYLMGLRQRTAGMVPFHEVARLLERFVTGLSGRHMRLESAEQAYTDTRSIFVPEYISRFEEKPRNFTLYKAMVAHLWAQTRFGTWRVPVQKICAGYPDAQRALCLFHALETIRLDACIRRSLTGLAREMAALQETLGAEYHSSWQVVLEQLQSPERDAHDSVRLLQRIYPTHPLPPARSYQGVMLPERSADVIDRRKRDDRRELQAMLAELWQSSRRTTETLPTAEEVRFRVDAPRKSDTTESLSLVLHMNDQPVTPQADLQQVLTSILLDFGFIPAEYLVPAGPAAGAGMTSAVPGGDAPVTPATGLLYDEWDHLRQQYRKGWCLLKERDAHPRYDDFVPRTLEKYRGLIKHLHRTFEALRGEDRRLRKEPFGDDLDLDAVITDYADQLAGREGDDRIFSLRRRIERDITVVLLVDMSGSTKGWINDIERESIILLCEAMEILGDRYAIYGFSGFTHKRCELMRIKGLDEPYSEKVQARISGIRPQDYTRMGVFIRHLTDVFQAVDSRTKLLITLTDGRPDDQDGYRGTYGIEDTRQALFEARYKGIHPYCITIDDEGMDYLPHMFGAVNFTVVSNVHQLPYKVSDIYRRLTL